MWFNCISSFWKQDKKHINMTPRTLSADLQKSSADHVYITRAMTATKCLHSHSGWTTKTVIWNMKKFLHVIFVYLSAASIVSGGWKWWQNVIHSGVDLKTGRRIWIMVGVYKQACLAQLGNKNTYHFVSSLGTVGHLLGISTSNSQFYPRCHIICYLPLLSVFNSFQVNKG